MYSSEQKPSSENLNYTPEQIRSRIRKMYTESSPQVSETAQTLISIFAQELKKEYGPDLHHSKYWHALNLNSPSSKSLSQERDEAAVRAVDNKINRFLIENLFPLIDPTEETDTSELATNIKALKGKLLEFSDKNISQSYQLQVNELVLKLKKKYPFSLVIVPEIDAVIGGGGNTERSGFINSLELQNAKDEFIASYMPIHDTFAKFFEENSAK